MRFRAATGIPAEAFVVGHVGRLAPEKNLEVLAKAVAAFLRTRPRAHFVVAGKGAFRSTDSGGLVRPRSQCTVAYDRHPGE